MDPAIALRTCRSDGLLIKPHTPIAAIDESLLSGPAFNSVPLVATCTSEHEAGTWTYVVAMHANPSDDPVTGEIRLSSLFSLSQSAAASSRIRPKQEQERVDDLVAWNWRTRTVERVSRAATIPVSLGPEDWSFHVLAPILPSGLAVIGDITKFATVGDARVEVAHTATGVRLVVKGGGENVTITGWAQTAPRSAEGIIDHDGATGVWSIAVEVPLRGWTSVGVDAGTLPMPPHRG